MHISSSYAKILGGKLFRTWENRRSGSKAENGEEKKNYLKKYFFLLLSSSYAKILGETNFHTREFPRSGSEAKDGEEEKKKERKILQGLRVAQASVTERWM